MNDLQCQFLFYVKRERTLQERFARFDRENPHVYQALLTIARRWKDAGHAHCSADFLCHVLRWETGLRTSGEPFKINNDYASRYARKMVAQYPQFAGFFAFRELKAA